MAKIQVNLTEPLLDGMDVRFKAPCDCTAIDGITVNFPLGDGSGTGSQTFTFKDAHGNTLTGLGNLFSKGVLVKVMVDRHTSFAYIQNADTNKYLEEKIENAGAEEGVPTVTTGLSGLTASGAKYVKVGKLVHCHFLMTGNIQHTTGTLLGLKVEGVPAPLMPAVLVLCAGGPNGNQVEYATFSDGVLSISHYFSSGAVNAPVSFTYIAAS